MNGDTKKFKLEYVTIEEVKNNSSKTSLDTLINLIELWSIDRNIHKSDSTKQALKIFEELGEVASALAKNKPAELKDGIGDVVVTLVILAQQNNLTLEECVQAAYDEIKGRTGKMVDGVFVKSSDL